MSRTVQTTADLHKIRETLQETGITPSAPDWGFHITAMWLASAAAEWAHAAGAPTRGTDTPN